MQGMFCYQKKKKKNLDYKGATSQETTIYSKLTILREHLTYIKRM